MNREEIRTKIRERLSKGILPCYYPIPREPGGAFEGYEVGVVRDHECSACDGKYPGITLKYPDKKIWFHEECEQIWREECEKPIKTS